MKEILKFETLIHLYFGRDGNHKRNAILRAYRDFNRTLELGKESKNDRERKKIEITNFLELELSKVLTEKFKNQREFDAFHEKLSIEIKNKWKKLTFGQIQKWINMSLKYWLVIGGNELQGIEKNHQFFHIPIDRIIKEKIFQEYDHKFPWSKIKNYNDYFKYQLKFRSNQVGIVPIIFESEIFIKK